MGFFDSKPNDVVAKGIIRDFGDIIGVGDVVDGYLALIESEIYKKTVFIGFIDSGEDEDPYNIDEFPLVRMAFNHLNSFPLRLPFIPLFDKKDFLVSYTFIWNIWRCQLGRELSLEENTAVFHSNLATRIIFLLEDFDSNLETTLVDEEFFRKLSIGFHCRPLPVLQRSCKWSVFRGQPAWIQGFPGDDRFILVTGNAIRPQKCL